MVCEQATNEERARAVSLLRLPIVLPSPSIRRKRHENVMSSVMGMDYPRRQGAKRPIPCSRFMPVIVNMLNSKQRNMLQKGWE